MSLKHLWFLFGVGRPFVLGTHPLTFLSGTKGHKDHPLRLFQGVQLLTRPTRAAEAAIAPRRLSPGAGPTRGGWPPRRCRPPGPAPAPPPPKKRGRLPPPPKKRGRLSMPPPKKNNKDKEETHPFWCCFMFLAWLGHCCIYLFVHQPPKKKKKRRKRVAEQAPHVNFTSDRHFWGAQSGIRRGVGKAGDPLKGNRWGWFAEKAVPGPCPKRVVFFLGRFDSHFGGGGGSFSGKPWSGKPDKTTLSFQVTHFSKYFKVQDATEL